MKSHLSSYFYAANKCIILGNMNINYWGENMKYTESISIKLKKYSPAVLSYIPLSFTLFFIAFLLLRFPETAAQGISDGIDLSLGTLIPTLYPFMVLSTLIIELCIFDRIPDFLGRLSSFLFALEGKCLGTIILSMIGGLPLGCKMTSEMYEKGEISRSQGRRMLLFCYCCGPAFAVSSVGLYMMGSKKAGVIIYASIILSSLTVGILSRFFEEEDNFYVKSKSNDTDGNFSSCFVRSVSKGSTAMLSVCSWVILFSSVGRLIEILPINRSVSFFLGCILEVTNGAYTASGKLPLPIIAGIIGFGGLCGHCQVMPYVIKLRLKYKFFFTSRIICGALSVIYCKALLVFFPVSYEVFSLGTLPPQNASGISWGVSVAMLFLAGLFLLGDSTVIRIKAKKDHRI